MITARQTRLRLIAAVALLGVLGAPLSVGAVDASSTSFQLDAVYFDGLSGESTSTSFQAGGQIPYVDGSVSTSTSYMFDSGFFASVTDTIATSSGGGGGGEGGGGGSGGSGGGGGGGGQPPPITLVGPATTTVATASEPSLIEKITKPIVDFFKPKPKPTAVDEIEKFVPRQTPLAFGRGRWDLIDPVPLRELVLKPLPAELRNLAGQMPQLNRLFAQVGIRTFNDLSKLKTASVKLPGLSDALELPSVPIGSSGIIKPKDLRLAELTPDLLEKFPRGVLFAKFADGLIDVSPTLRVNTTGGTEQLIRTVTGSTISLSVRPEFTASNVMGYLVFKGRGQRAEGFSGDNSLSALQRLFGVSVARAQQAPIETALVLQTFPFSDTDRDGVFTAQIEAPVVAGEYEIITAITYQDADKGTRLLRMVTLVDPEGYIYETVGGKEVRIPGAIVTIEWFNTNTNVYEVWPAQEYAQENPQITGVTGQYSFLVPPGLYRLKVEAPGYALHDGKAFAVREGSGVHENIELTTRFQFLKTIDWKTAGMLILFLLVLYNFYRDKRRGREGPVQAVSPPQST